MTEYPLNPWLADVVQQYRQSGSEFHMREWYKMSCDSGDELSWQEYVIKSFMEVHLNRTPFLRKPLELLPLSDEAKDILYWAGVDKVSDLLQITKEELDAIIADSDEITRYLANIGEELKRYPGRTSKYSLAYGYWTIPSPGASHCFNVARPTLRQEWFDEYYRLYGHFFAEENHRQVFESVIPVFIDDYSMNEDYEKFFQTAEQLFDYYSDCCEYCKLEPRVMRPKMPDRDVRFIYREGVKAVVDIFERTALLKHAEAVDYLSTIFDEIRLSIADGENHYENFREFLYRHVELKIGIENISITLHEFMSGRHRKQFILRDEPEKHPFAGAIRRLREKVSDETLRMRYKKELENNPDLGWEEFIVQTAIAEP